MRNAARARHHRTLAVLGMMGCAVILSFALPLAHAQNTVSQPVQPETDEIVGVVESMDDTTLVVNGIPVDIQHVVLDEQIAVGVLVEVHGYVAEDGSFIAYEVELDDADADDDGLDDEEDADDDNDGVDDDLDADDDGDGIEDEDADADGVDDDLDEDDDDDGIADDEDEDDDGDDVADDEEDNDDFDEDGVDNVEDEDDDEDGVLDNEDEDDDNDTVNDEVDSDDDNDHVDDVNDDLVACATSTPAGWTTYTVQPGDTLSSIAAGSDLSLEDLMLVNCVSDPGFIAAGTTLFVSQTPELEDSADDDSSDDDGQDDDGSDDSGDDHGDDDSSDDDHGDDDSEDGDDD